MPEIDWENLPDKAEPSPVVLPEVDLSGLPHQDYRPIQWQEAPLPVSVQPEEPKIKSSQFIAGALGASPDIVYANFEMFEDIPDQETVTQFKQRVDSIVRPVPALAAAGYLKAASTVAGLIGIDAEEADIDVITGAGYRETKQSLAERWREEVDIVNEQIMKENPLERNSWSEATRNAFVSIYTQAPSYAVGLLLRGRAVALGLMGTQAGLEKGAELQAAGYENFEVMAATLASGTSEVMTEMIPFDAFVDIVKKSPGMGKSLVKLFLGEQIGEQINTVVDSTIDKVTINKDMTWDEYLDRVEMTAKATLVQSFLMIGAGTSARILIERGDMQTTIDEMPEEVKAQFEEIKAEIKGDEIKKNVTALNELEKTAEGKAYLDAKIKAEGIPTTEQVLERITTEELTDEQLTEMLDIFAEGQEIIAEDVEAVSEIKSRLIDIGMSEEEASSNAALYAGFDVLAKRAGVPLDDLITRYLPEISQRDMIPEITDEDRRIVSDNPVLNNVITDEAQLESFDELRGIRNDLETELEANRGTWSEEQISQQEEAIAYLNTKVTEEQLIGGIPRGRIRFYSDKVNIDLLKDADQSTFVHETGHLYLMMMNDLANVETASQELKDDFQIIKDWLGVVDGEITRDQNEQFARGFEAYLREGKAPTPALKKAFENFKKWLMEIYRSLSDLDVELTDDVRGAMDRMFIDEGMEAPVRGEVAAAERGVEFEQRAAILKRFTSEAREKILSDPRVKIGLKVGKTAKFWRGVGEASGTSGATYGEGLYVAGSKTEAQSYVSKGGRVVEMDIEDLPRNPLRFQTINDFQIWVQQAHKTLGYKGPREVNVDFPNFADFIQAIDPEIDGIQISTGKDAIFVNYEGRKVFEQPPTKTTFKEETEPTFSPREVTSNPVPADILENPAKAVKNYLPSHAEKGQYFYMTANDLQAHLDKHGDGFLYRVGDRRSVEGGFERGKQGYLHKFATENKKTLALNTSLEGAKKYLASSLSPEYNIIYRIMPQDLADDFIIHIPSNEAARNEGDLIIHSPKPASTSMARVLYSQGNFTEEDTDVSRRAIEQRRAAKVEEGTRRAAGVRVRPGVAEGRPERVGAEAEAGKPVITRNKEGEVFYQSAFHGTPHKFDKFTLDHIGKGEGAQAYGWGLYFAESKDVARYYREALTPEKEIFIVNGERISEEDISFEEYTVISSIARKLNIDKVLEGIKEEGRYSQQEINDIEKAVDKYRDAEISLMIERPSGALLRVELAPKADEWLDWDKPLSEQSKTIKDILKKEGISQAYKKNLDNFASPQITRGREIRGSNIYEFIQYEKKMNPEEASLYLRSIGIPGIRYLDATSRGKERGTSNYVVFDESLIEIQEFMQAPKKKPSKRQKPVKTIIREVTGQKKAPELKQLREDFLYAARAAKQAFKEGKDLGSVKEARKLKNILARARKIRIVRDYFNLSDADLKKISRKNPLLMSQYEFKLYIDDVRVKAVQLTEEKLAKAILIKTIHEKDLNKVDNYRRVLNLPPISKMTTNQAKTFAEALEDFHDGDTFLSERELETVDRTDLEGIKTWREARERLAKEVGKPVEELSKIKVKEWDEYKWDTALAEANPFYKMLVTETTRKLLEADMRTHDIENEVFDLARKSEKSRGRTLVERAIPQDKQIMEYLETPVEERDALIAEMTPEQVDLAHYMESYFASALEYLIQTKALARGRENYFVHMRRTFLENVKEEGLLGAFRDLFKTYQEDEATFNILDDDTGNILPLEKFFQFALRRTGGLKPTSNVIRGFLVYAQMLEKKRSLDELIPKMDIYAQSLTPEVYTPRGLEIDRSIKQFVNKYINNKKGRHIRWIAKQGGTIDVSIRGLRTFTTLVDLGLNIPTGVAAFVGEQVANFEMLGTKGYTKGTARIKTAKGKAILDKYEAFVGRSAWEEFRAPGKQLTERISDGLFGLFHEASVLANKQFLLGVLTEAEYNSGEISSERLAEIKIEMGRFRVVPGTKSLVGSTSAGSAMMQYKTWAAPIIRTLSKNAVTLTKDLSNKPAGEALTTREAREIYRFIALTATAVIVGAMAASDDDDESFTGQLLKKMYRESMTLLQGVDPTLWLATPRIMGFMTQLGKNLKAIATLEEYKTKPGLKGVDGLQRQLTPRAVKQILPEKQKTEKL